MDSSLDTLTSDTTDQAQPAALPAPVVPVRSSPPLTISPITSITGPPPAVDPRAEIARRQAAANEMFWNQLRSKTQNLPLAQTEAAVAAALRFQAQRQYQRDLASGMSPGEALARSAPLMFGQPKQGNLGQAASFIRSTAPRPPTVRDAAGILYRINQDGSVTALTPPKVVAPKPSTFDTEEYRATLREMADTRKQIDQTDIGGAQADALRAKLGSLANQLQDIRKRTPAAPTMGTSNTGPTPTITTRQEWDALPPGSVYINKGKKYRKPYAR